MPRASAKASARSGASLAAAQLLNGPGLADSASRPGNDPGETAADFFVPTDTQACLSRHDIELRFRWDSAAIRPHARAVGSASPWRSGFPDDPRHPGGTPARMTKIRQA
jgi:hypothetical protein